MAELLYYIQNVERGYCGNSVYWWKEDDNGYTLDIRVAKKFTHDEAWKLVNGRNKYKMFLVSHIDKLVQHHIDIQDLNANRKIPWTSKQKSKRI